MPGRMSLPNLIVVGAMKAGTTSLHHYLDRHPQIWMSPEKEVNFFAHERRFRRKADWYAGLFPTSSPIRGETSPNYAKYPLYPEVPRRIHELIPSVRLVYIVRDPIERVLSHYHHAYCDHLEDRSLEEALSDLQDNHYVRCSLYAMQLRRYLDYFDLDAIHIVDSAELRRDPEASLKDLFDFLGVDSQLVSHETPIVRNASAGKGRRRGLRLALSKLRGKTRLKRLLPSSILQLVDRWTLQSVPMPEISDSLRARLSEAFVEDIADFRALTGQKLGSWSVS